MLPDGALSARHVVFSSGGAFGACFCGALKGLEEELESRGSSYAEWHSNLKGAAGSSAGGMLALAAVTGLPPASLEEAWRRGAERPIASRLFEVSSLRTLVDEYGMERGEALEEAVGECLDACGVAASATFEDLRRLTGKRLVICATEVEGMRPLFLDHDTAPHMRVGDALRASASIPLVFTPFKRGGSLLADGALTRALPVDPFPKKDVLCFMITVRNPPRCASSLASYVSCLMNAPLALQEREVEADAELRGRVVRVAPTSGGWEEMLCLGEKRMGWAVRLGKVAFDCWAGARERREEREAVEGVVRLLVG